MIDDILLFVQVVSAGSILAVEKKLGISKSTISRRIQNLETALGGTLLNRSSQGVALTMLGHNIFGKFKDYEAKLSGLLADATKVTKVVTGRLNLLLPYTLIGSHVIPKIRQLLLKHPQLQVNIMHNYNEFNMQKEQYDLAIINYLPKQQSQKIKVLGVDKVILVCTPEYINEHGRWEEIRGHAQHLIVGKPSPGGSVANEVPLFNELTDEVVHVKYNPRIVFSSFTESKAFVMGHNGIAGLPLSFIHEELADGRLIRLLPNFHAGFMPYYLMRNLEETDSRYRVFMDFILQCFAEDLGVDKTSEQVRVHLFHG